MYFLCLQSIPAVFMSLDEDVNRASHVGNASENSLVLRPIFPRKVATSGTSFVEEGTFAERADADAFLARRAVVEKCLSMS